MLGRGAVLGPMEQPRTTRRLSLDVRLLTLCPSPGGFHRRRRSVQLSRRAGQCGSRRLDAVAAHVRMLVRPQPQLTQPLGQLRLPSQQPALALIEPALPLVRHLLPKIGDTVAFIGGGFPCVGELLTLIRSLIPSIGDTPPFDRGGRFGAPGYRQLIADWRLHLPTISPVIRRRTDQACHPGT